LPEEINAFRRCSQYPESKISQENDAVEAIHDQKNIA
jgi:hypothetical protein